MTTAAYDTMVAIVYGGEPFTTADLRNAGMKYGLTHSRAGTMANTLTQKLKRERVITITDHAGSGFTWQLSKKVPPPPIEAAPIPQPSPVLVVGPFDPAPEVEGGNSGMTERLAEFFWQLMGRKDVDIYKDKPMAETAPVMEANGWRHLALKTLEFLAARGLTGPGGVRPLAAGWDYAWVYAVGDWCIYDGQGRFVATMGEEEDLPIVCAAPRMASAIQTVIANFEVNGAVKRSDLALLRQAVEGLPLIDLPDPANKEPTDGIDTPERTAL